MAIKLRNLFEDARARDGTNKYFQDEIIPWTIQDYHGMVGSLEDFTSDDFAVAEEFGWSRDDLKWLCED